MNVPNDLQKIIDQLEAAEGFKVSNFSSLSGGSINTVYLLKTTSGERVIKLNKASEFPSMFEAEKEGLEALRNSNTIDVPEAFSCGTIDFTSYLLLEHKPEGKPLAEFPRLFAEDLAALHKISAPDFGFHSSNYIGSLPQYNGKETSASDFYIHQRIEPQIKMASERGFSFSDLDTIFKNIAAEIPEESPALIHGDLWSGNYLVNSEGRPCLIDPAVSYGPREMDLAMMKLFGGFSEEIFRSYQEIFPLEPGFQKRIPLWQLYYLLVHLNIFGSSYLSRVKSILNNFS
ncbi:aminoglycoside phosphotransferase [Salinimicrobium marinum]|uniref:Aminoglycoside phosphotransferase n=1 Tax=Salinimicrobium marinum TaxID=680283 RepID=A0A918S662_9FLAO|nr:fructosamine kinase family protein [Salinimicrobium marinum]GHA26156.1 aminoglycoside phosphotransferase [Salinimicrobium marinum]